MNGASPGAIESSAYRSASSLMKLLKSLGVEDEDLRLLFIQIPNATMYWLHPRDFKVRPALVTIATNYKDFFGTTGSDARRWHEKNRLIDKYNYDKLKSYINLIN